MSKIKFNQNEDDEIKIGGLGLLNQNDDFLTFLNNSKKITLKDAASGLL